MQKCRKREAHGILSRRTNRCGINLGALENGNRQVFFVSEADYEADVSLCFSGVASLRDISPSVYG